MKVVSKLIPVKVYNILINLLPMIVLFSVVMASIRIISAIYSKEKIVLYKELKNLIYIIYCFTLFNLVTTTDFESFSNNFIPFKEIMRYRTTSVLFYRNVIGNIALFIPFGFMITDMLKEKAGKTNILITTLITFFTSLTIEIIQMFIGRSFDIDDILLNLVGGILGFLIFHTTQFIYKHIPDEYKTNKIKLLFFIFMILLFILLFIILYEVAKWTNLK